MYREQFIMSNHKSLALDLTRDKNVDIKSDSQ